MNVNLFSLAPSVQAQIAAAVIASIAAFAAVCGLLYTWLSGKWKASDRINMARSKVRLGLFKNDKDGSPYVNPVNYYKDIQSFKDELGNEFLVRNIPFQTKDMKFDFYGKIIFNHKLYGAKYFNSKLYNEDRKMTMENMKNYNSLIMFIDKQINNYLNKRDRNHETLWNLKKFNRFIEVLRAKLISVKKQVEAVPVNEMTYDVADGKAKLTFFYSFIVRDYSSLMNIDLVKGEKVPEDFKDDEVVKLMQDFPGLYERERTKQYEYRVNKKLRTDMFLHVQWKQSSQCVDANTFIKQNTDKKLGVENIFDDNSAYNIKSGSLEIGDKMGIFRHLKIKSDSIRFDVNDKPFYIYNPQDERNILMMGSKEKKFSVGIEQQIKAAKKQAILDTLSFNTAGRYARAKYEALKKHKNDQDPKGYEIKKWAIDLSKKYGMKDNDYRSFNDKDKEVLDNLLKEMFIKADYPNAESISDLHIYKASASELKGTNKFGIVKPKIGEYLLDRDEDNSNFAYSLEKDSKVFKKYASEVYCLDELKDAYGWKNIKEL